jgi:hypothetical protein
MIAARLAESGGVLEARAFSRSAVAARRSAVTGFNK